MELAYKSITTERGEPIPCRLQWNISARHIVRYRKIKKNLKTTLYKKICDEQEECWRDKFYTLLKKINNCNFFELKEGTPIAPHASALVYSMSAWPKDKPDPIDEQTFESIVKQYELWSCAYRHFRDYIKTHHPKLAVKFEKNGSQQGK